jgi:hypothetical protein
MWKPDKPIVIAGEALTVQEAWWREFSNTFHELCGGEIDAEWLDGLAATLYPLNVDRPPREAAEVAFVTLGYELPGTELEDPFTPPTPRPKPGMH